MKPVAERLELEPAGATILQDDSQPYTVQGFAKGNKPLGDITAKTEVTITAPGRCTSGRLGKVSCTASEVGEYTVTGTLSQTGRDRLRATATLRVIDPVVSLALAIVFLPHQAWASVDAIVRTLWRMAVSRRHLLQWQTASQIERGTATSAALGAGS